MKAAVAALLLVSLAANAVLWIRSQATDAENVAGKVPDSITTASPERISVQTVGAGAPPSPDAAHGDGIRWDGLPTGDPEALARELRERGYPPHIVRGVVGHYLNEQYQARRDAVRTEIDVVPYWKPNAFTQSDNASQRAELRALTRELAERLGELTGTEATMLETGSVYAMRQRYGNLPVATLEAVMAIEQDYSELARDIRGTGLVVVLPSDREKLALLEEEKRKDLLSVLTPEQYEELQLRSSPTAQRLRTSLAVMKPSELEFRTIHRLQKEYDDRFATSNVSRNSPGFREQQRMAEQELIASVKAELGTERGEAYEKSRDGQYVHAHMVAKQLNLTPDAGDQLYALQKDAFQEYNRIGSAAGMNADQRRAAQLEFVQARKSAITRIVGEDNLATYQSGMGGWLNALEQNANRTPSTTQGGTLRISSP